MADERATTAQSDGGFLAGPLPQAIAEVLGERVIEGGVSFDGLIHITVPPGELIPTLTALARELDPPYSYLSDLCGVDRPDCVEAVYHLFRPMTDEGIVVRVRLSRRAPRVETVTSLWETANWAEREAAEMFGISFSGHPDPRPLLLPEELRGNPLRKDWAYPEEHPYLTREPLHEQFPQLTTPARYEPPAPPEPRDPEQVDEGGEG